MSATNTGRSPLGSPAKHARIRFALPGAAVPALVGAAAAFALVGAPAGSAAAAQVQAHHTAATAVTAAIRQSDSAAHLLAVVRPATAQSSAAATSYTVQSGDTLSSIAQRFYQNPAYWPAIYQANQSQVQNPNLIQVGQVLAIPAQPSQIPAAPSSPASAPVQQQSYSAPAPVQAPVQSAAQQYDPAQQSAPTEQQSAPTQQSSASSQDSTVSTAGDSSFQACVIQRESGGNPQVTNSSGHYGLYQFSESTWVEYGGSAADFGNATVAQQNQVFDNAIAAGGESNWAPYDGC
jgi:LysM repeat protein